MNPAPTNDPYYRPRAVIFIPNTDALEAGARCLDHVQRRRFHLVGTVTDYDEARRYLEDGRADVMVMDRPDDVPPTTRRQFEFAAQWTPGRNQGRVHRRTRVIRPSAAE